MKKTFLFSMTIALLFVFTSCEKDGVYNPKKKISKIYMQYEDAEKELFQTWTWNGNLLSQIVDTYGVKQVFEYDGKRIDKIRYTENRTDYNRTATTDFIYDGKKIFQIKDESTTSGDGYSRTFQSTGEVSYDGKKISKIAYTCETTDYSEKSCKFMANQVAGTISYLMGMPQERPNMESQLVSFLKKKTKNQTKSTNYYNYEVRFKYDGNNLVECDYDYGDGDVSKITFTINEDVLNPMYGLLNSIDGEAYDEFSFTRGAFSKNLPSRVILTDDGEANNFEYGYTCTKKYPQEIRVINKPIGYDAEHYTYYYEYK